MRREDACLLLVFMAITVALIVCGWYSSSPTDGPSFSVKLTAVDGLVPEGGGPVIHPVFDLTLRVHNGQSAKTCRDNITVTVLYGNMVLGWGRVPDFCVDEWASMEMSAAVSNADVVLADDLRSRLDSELLAGALELDVETRMWFPEGQPLFWECRGCSSRECLGVCRVNTGQDGYAPCHTRPLYAAH
ncbi:hypothetical protein D1007_20109 [Hordeum vulgare]|nr:hypothetical protein D1007_20109 [Hordeum vulgare]